MNELSVNKKEYGRTIKEKDIENIKLREADKYHGLALNIIKDTIESFLECALYKEMKKNEDIEIMAGEYMDASVMIYSKRAVN